MRSLMIFLALAAPVPVHAQKTGDAGWQLKTTAGSCYLTRRYGGTDLIIQGFGPVSPYHVILRGDGIPKLQERAAEIEISSGAHQGKVFGIIGASGKTPAAVFLISTQRKPNFSGWAFVGKPGSDAVVVTGFDRAAENLTVSMPGSPPLSFDLGPMGAEYERLDQCAQAKVDAWQEAASPGAVPVTPPDLHHDREMSWQTQFPDAEVLNRISGTAEVRMTVGTDGRAHDCVVLTSTFRASFGKTVCEVYESRARFEPAKNGAGESVAALYQTGAIFVIYNW